MHDPSKTYQELIEDNSVLKQKIRELEQSVLDAKLVEEKLKNAEGIYRNIFMNSQIGLFRTDIKTGLMLEANDSMARFAGYKDREELLAGNFNIAERYIDSQARQRMLDMIRQSGRCDHYETLFRRNDGSVIWIRLSVKLVANKGWLEGVAEDITERKIAEDSLKESEEKYRELVDFLPISLFECDLQGNVISVNPSTYDIFGYQPSDIEKPLNGFQMIAQADQERLAANIQNLLNGQINNPSEYIGIRKDGSSFPMMIFPRVLIHKGKPAGFRGAIVDLTSLKHAETELLQAEERYRSIFEHAQEGIFRTTPEGKFIMANPAMARILGYSCPEELMEKVTDISQQLYVNPEERQNAMELIKSHGLTKEDELQFYKKDGSITRVYRTMQAIHDEQGRLLYLEGLIEDVSDRKNIFDKLRKALGGTVLAIAAVVETKDPYTAGHQRRVADISRAIATEMGLTREMIEGLRMAGIIHDIGKVAVPSEILSSPRKLSNIEFNLIKTHAQSGYDMLKDIEFPWPIARIVLEHHERMDGSGYPNGLTRESILLESRILAVADVVEAMATHRPYRPALGLDAALKEIAENKGRLYDTDAVDCCLRLFLEKNYKIRE